MKRLLGIIGELGVVLKPLARNWQLKRIDLTVTRVDGTLVAALPRIMETSW